jgi:hypothetical protein
VTLAAAWSRAAEPVGQAESGPLDAAARSEVARVWREIVASLPPPAADSPWATERVVEVGSFLARYAGMADTPACASDFLGLAEWAQFAELCLDAWGGPFNGQRRRQEIFRELEHRCGFAAVVETGTFRGDTTEWLAQLAARPVFSIEISPRFHRFAQQRLHHLSQVHLARGDSRLLLDRLASDPLCPRERVLFYLDAHWGQSLPIAEELARIAGAWRRSVVVIDDFRVPDDAGYGWDDYGAAGRLELGAVPLDLLRPETVLWPAAKSELETGNRRGCVVVAMPGALPSPASLVTLRGPHTG